MQLVVAPAADQTVAEDRSGDRVVAVLAEELDARLLAREEDVVALVGPDEAAKGTVSVKVLASGERAELPRAEAAAWIRSRTKT